LYLKKLTTASSATTRRMTKIALLMTDVTQILFLSLSTIKFQNRIVEFKSYMHLIKNYS